MSSLLKALDLLNYFTPQNNTLLLKQLCDASGYNKTTTYRMLNDLTKAGILHRNDATKQYTIGDKIHKLSNIGRGHVLSADIRKLIDELSTRVQETVHCSTFDNDTVWVQYVVESPRRLRVVVDQNVLPIDRTGSGLLFLSEQSTEKQQELLGGAINKDIQQHLDFIKKHGYMLNKGMFDKDAFSISAPIFDGKSTIYICISVVVPLSQITPEFQRDLTHTILQYAQKIMHNINGMPPPNYITQRGIL